MVLEGEEWVAFEVAAARGGENGEGGGEAVELGGVVLVGDEEEALESGAIEEDFGGGDGRGGFENGGDFRMPAWVDGDDEVGKADCFSVKSGRSLLFGA